MRSILRWAIHICLFLLSIDTIAATADWFGRWDWWASMLLSHPSLAAVVRGPFFPMLCLALCMLAIYGDKFLKRPAIIARYRNSVLIPDRHSTTLQSVFDSQDKKPGWDRKELNWEWFIETQITNESDTPTTVEDIEVSVRARTHWWLLKNVPVGIRKLPAKHIADLSAFELGKVDSLVTEGDLPSLLSKTKGVPITKGIGHRGWLRVELKANQRDLNNHPMLTG